MLSRKILFGTVVVVLVFCEISSLDVQFERLELMNASYVEGKYNISLLRVSRINRTTYSMNVEFETFQDIGTEFSFEVLFYFNRFNNNQYNRHPLAIPKMGFCDATEKYYKILKGFFQDYSNFPQFPEGEPACPFPKVSCMKILPIEFTILFYFKTDFLK